MGVIESEARQLPAQHTPQADSITSLISSIERAVSNPKINVDKMERLFKMSQEAMARQAEVSFNASMAECQGAMPAVQRDAENTQTHSWYSRLETLNKAIVPIYSRHGFSLSFNEVETEREGYIKVACQCSHRDGHSRLYNVEVPLDLTGLRGNENKTPMHAFGSSCSYGRRYLTLLIFNVAMAGEDNDGNGAGKKRPEPQKVAGATPAPPTPKYITESQAADLLGKITEVGADKAAFMKVLKVNSLSEVLASQYAGAIQRLNDKARGTR